MCPNALWHTTQYIIKTRSLSRTFHHISWDNRIKLFKYNYFLVCSFAVKHATGFFFLLKPLVQDEWKERKRAVIMSTTTEQTHLLKRTPTRNRRSLTESPSFYIQTLLWTETSLSFILNYCHHPLCMYQPVIYTVSDDNTLVNLVF